MDMTKTRGMIIRSAQYGENAKMLTVLSEDFGKISVSAKGASSVKRGAAALHNFCYSEFVLIRHPDIYSLSEVSPIESFFGLSSSLDYMETAARMMRFTDYICHENEPAGEILRITLNCLYAMSKLGKNHKLVLAVFLFKILCISGFEPELYSCSTCGDTENLSGFSCEYGGTICLDCISHMTGSFKISDDALMMMRHISDCDIKQLFKFSADEKTADEVLKIAKLFISEHLEYQID